MVDALGSNQAKRSRITYVESGEAQLLKSVRRPDAFSRYANGVARHHPGIVLLEADSKPERDEA